MLNRLKPFLQKPPLFEAGTAELWTDEHISKGMLEAHLHPSRDAATRNHEFVESSVKWLGSILPPVPFPALIDLGCGPGIYAERLYAKGYAVTGIDISQRSVEYAVQQAQQKQLPIVYRHENYLEMTDKSQFDIATLIFCDLGVLSHKNRSLLLKKVNQALKPEGYFVFDVFTPCKYEGRTETRTWEYHNAGFFKPTPYLSLESFYAYPSDNTYLNQYLIVTEHTVECFNVWEHTFTIEELKTELTEAGFSEIRFFSDMAGAPYTNTSHTICVVAGK